MTRRFDRTGFRDGVRPAVMEPDGWARAIPARRVFVAGGMPGVTYVDRAAFRLEARLNSEIREGYKVITVTGPSQSGKTVLTRHVLGSREAALVNGGHVGSSLDFWTLLRQELTAPDIDRSEDRAAHHAATAPVGTLINGHNRASMLRHMRVNDITLVVDDFHHLPAEVQLEIGRALKSEVFEGLAVILIAVPRNTFDAIGMEREMEGRIAHVEIPPWGPGELREIPDRGFAELNMIVDGGALRRLTEAAHGNPLLVQRFCGRLCDHFDVHAPLATARTVEPGEGDMREIFGSVGPQLRFSDLRNARTRAPVALNMD